MFKKIFVVILLISSPFTFSSDIDNVKNKISKLKNGDEALSVIANSGNPLILFNYILGKKVVINKPADLTDEEAAQFIPPLDGFLDLYIKYLDEGNKPYQAMILTNMSPQAMQLIK